MRFFARGLFQQELDYATNFLADGPGQWKDSGLGEAFRAAVVNPDIINIIDWKPYGCHGMVILDVFCASNVYQFVVTAGPGCGKAVGNWGNCSVVAVVK